MANSTSFDLEGFFADLPPTRGKSPFDLWLEADPSRTARFWLVMEEAADRGVGIRPVLDLWNSRFDPCPVKHNQVRLKLNERKNRA